MCGINDNQPIVTDHSIANQANLPVDEQAQPETDTVNRPGSQLLTSEQRQSRLPEAPANMPGRRGHAGPGAFLKSLKENITTFFDRFKKTTLAELSTTINLSVDGNQVECDSRILNLKFPAGTTSEAIRAKLQAKINDGALIYQAVISDNRNIEENPCTTEDMTDLAWYLQLKCEAKSGDHFRDGAMTLPDDNGRLMAFLDSHKKAYQRASTHLKRFQKQGHSQRGIDARGKDRSDKLKDVLPYGLRTMLYGKIPAEGTPLMDSDRIFIKMEIFGCPCLTKLLKKVEGTPFDPNAPKVNFWRTPADFAQFLGHMRTSIAGNPRVVDGKDGSLEMVERKERIPQDLVRDYNALKDYINENVTPDDLKNQMLQLLDRNEPFDPCSGIRVMQSNAEAALGIVKQQDRLYLKQGITPESLLAYERPERTGRGSALEQTEPSQLGEWEDKVLDFLQKIVGNQNYDSPGLRFGNEIILTAEDL